MSMTCLELPEVAAELLGGEISPERRAGLLAHLERCSACAGELDGMEELLLHARRLPVPEPAPAYWAAYLPRLRRRLESSQAPGLLERLRGAARWLQPLAAVSALVLAALLLPPPAPDSDLLPPASLEPSGEQLAQAHALSSGFDWLSPELAFPLEAIAADQADLPASSIDPPSGDLLGFFAATGSLSLDQTRDLLSELELEFPG